MPTITELLRAEGVEITPELEAKLPTLAEASDEVRNVVTAKNDLLKWKQDNSDKVTGYDELQAKHDANLNEREQLAIENKDFQAQIEIREEREAKQAATIKLRNDQAKASSLEAGQQEIASMFSCKETGKMLAKNFVSTDIDEDGNIAKSYNLNGETFDNFKSFKEAASKVDYLAKQIAAPASSGPSGFGGKGGDSTGGNTPQDNLRARLQQKGMV